MTSYRQTRRHFLAALPALTAFGQAKPLDIAAVEIWQLHGHRDATLGCLLYTSDAADE